MLLVLWNYYVEKEFPFCFRDDLINYNFKSTIINIKVVAVFFNQLTNYQSLSLNLFICHYKVLLSFGS